MNIKTSEVAGEGEKATLVFPATHPDGLKYLDAARERGEMVVAATSEIRAELPGSEEELIVLPYVYDAGFAKLFLDLVRRHNIARVYAPVGAVYCWLGKFNSEHGLGLRLVGELPIKREVGNFKRLINKATSYRRFINECAGGASDLADLEIAAVFRMADHIYGESNEHKIAAMIAIFSSAPKGDVVEIGSLVGKSAAVLAFLARRYSIGNVLAIDPWLSEAAIQHDSPSLVKVDLMGEFDEWDAMPADFIVNLLPVGLGIFNYLRLNSVKGVEVYRQHGMVENNEFGRVNYSGSIAVIHIDGNHDYAQVKQDCELWLPWLAKDGWLVLDDYQWAHGDGPCRVGDELMLQSANKIERCFVCGKALFIKFGKR